MVMFACVVTLLAVWFEVVSCIHVSDDGTGDPGASTTAQTPQLAMTAADDEDADDDDESEDSRLLGNSSSFLVPMYQQKQLAFAVYGQSSRMSSRADWNQPNLLSDFADSHGDQEWPLPTAVDDPRNQQPLNEVVVLKFPYEQRNLPSSESSEGVAFATLSRNNKLRTVFTAPHSIGLPSKRPTDVVHRNGVHRSELHSAYIASQLSWYMKGRACAIVWAQGFFPDDELAKNSYSHGRELSGGSLRAAGLVDPTQLTQHEIQNHESVFHAALGSVIDHEMGDSLGDGAGLFGKAPKRIMHFDIRGSTDNLVTKRNVDIVVGWGANTNYAEPQGLADIAKEELTSALKAHQFPSSSVPPGYDWVDASGRFYTGVWADGKRFTMTQQSQELGAGVSFQLELSLRLRKRLAEDEAMMKRFSRAIHKIEKRVNSYEVNNVPTLTFVGGAMMLMLSVCGACVWFDC